MYNELVEFRVLYRPKNEDDLSFEERFPIVRKQVIIKARNIIHADEIFKKDYPEYKVIKINVSCKNIIGVESNVDRIIDDLFIGTPILSSSPRGHIFIEITEAIFNTNLVTLCGVLGA